MVMLIEDTILLQQNRAAKEGVDVATAGKRMLAFIYRTSLNMGQQLQDITLNSVHMYRRIWEAYFTPRLPQRSLLGRFDSVSSSSVAQARGTCKPMFKIKLLLTTKFFIFYPLLLEVEKTVVQLVDNMVADMSSIQDLQTRLEDVFHLEVPSYFQAVAANHPVVVDSKRIIKVRSLCSTFMNYFGGLIELFSNST